MGVGKGSGGEEGGAEEEEEEEEEMVMMGLAREERIQSQCRWVKMWRLCRGTGRGRRRRRRRRIVAGEEEEEEEMIRNRWEGGDSGPVVVCTCV